MEEYETKTKQNESQLSSTLMLNTASWPSGLLPDFSFPNKGSFKGGVRCKLRKYEHLVRSGQSV